MGECAHPANDNLSAANTVQWHSCNSDMRPAPTMDEVGIPVNPLASVTYKGVNPGGAVVPFEHKTIPFREDLYNPPQREVVEYNPTGYNTTQLARHEHGGIPINPEPTNCVHYTSGPTQATKGEQPLEQEGQIVVYKPLGEMQKFPRAEPPCEVFLEGRVPPYPNGYGCSSDVKRSPLTTIPYTADIKEQIQETKTILRLMDSENDPLPFPNMLAGPNGGSCCSKHKTNLEEEPKPIKTPATRLRELSSQLRAKSQKMQCMDAEYRRHFGTSLPYAADQVALSGCCGGGGGGTFGASNGGYSMLSPRTIQTPRVETLSLPHVVTLDNFEGGLVRADGVGPLQVSVSPMVQSKPPGTTIPYRADNEPPPIYTRPPPTHPYVHSDQIETLNIEVRNNFTNQKTPLTLMSPGSGGCATIESHAVAAPQCGELILTRTPRSTTWQEAYHQIRTANAARPVSADRYRVASTYRDTISCEYQAPVMGQRVPLPHVHVVQGGSRNYKQHLYPDGQTSSHYLWKKIEGKVGLGQSTYWR